MMIVDLRSTACPGDSGQRMLSFLSTKSLVRLFPSTIRNQQSTVINRDSTPRFAGQAKATAYARGRLLLALDDECRVFLADGIDPLQFDLGQPRFVLFQDDPDWEIVTLRRPVPFE